MWKIALKGAKTKRCFRDRLNQVAIKLKIGSDQEEWLQPRAVARNLRKARKVRRAIEKEAQTLRNQEREENIIKTLPRNRNKEVARKDVAHRMRQKAQFQQKQESVRGLRSGGISLITTPEYPYDPTEVRRWRDEHDTQKIENVLLEMNKNHLRQAAVTPFSEAILQTIPLSADSEIAEKLLSGDDIESPTTKAT